MQRLRKNFGLKLLALVLAMLGWAYFRFASNPVIASRFDQQLSVPIVTANLPVDYIAHFTDKEVVVTVASKRGAPPVKPEELKAVLDLSGKQPGIYNVPVQLVAPNIAVQSLSPASVSLTIERIIARVYPLDLHYVGSSANDVVIGTASAAPNTVSVRGPASSLAQITALHVDVPLPGSPRTFDAMVRPRAVNSLGQEIDGVEVVPDLVRVSVKFVVGNGAKTP